QSLAATAGHISFPAGRFPLGRQLGRAQQPPSAALERADILSWNGIQHHTLCYSAKRNNRCRPPVWRTNIPVAPGTINTDTSIRDLAVSRSPGFFGSQA